MAYDNLFKEYKLNDKLVLQNKIVMAPLTRCFADENLVPTQEMADYYEKRADAGLIISEGNIISHEGQGYPNVPGIYTQEQIEGWKLVTSQVHKRGAKIFSQVWHVGRVSLEEYHGQQPVAPSAVLLSGRAFRTDFEYKIPRALEISEIKELIQKYAQAAINSMEAGFDGIELHSANGYLPDQFLHQQTNVREDEYGGSVENRARFTLEALDAIIEAVGKDKVGIRISPCAYLHLEYTKGDEDTFKYLLKEIEKRNILYTHTGIFDDTDSIDYLEGKVSEFVRSNYNGTVIGNGSYSAQDGDDMVKDEKIDLFAIGRSFIANPDLITKLKNNEPVVDYDAEMLSSLV